MIEVIYKEKNQESQDETEINIPRNIRQIGQTDENCKIYMEDYVYTFLIRLSRVEEKDEQSAKVAVLTGNTEWMAGISYLFIRGALVVEDMEAAEDHIDFTEEIWKKIHAEQKKYFGEQEIAGWFFSRSQISMEVGEIFSKVHLKHFGGEKVLMLMEPQEREEAFFCYENGYMKKQKGYYIFYEKNPQMQTYMIEKSEELQSEAAENCEDQAVKNFRRIITDKKEKKQTEKERVSMYSYGATACLAAAVIMVGVNFYRNYQSMKGMEAEIQQTSSVIVEETTPMPSPKPTKVPQPTKKPKPTKIPKPTDAPKPAEEPKVVEKSLEQKQEPQIWEDKTEIYEPDPSEVINEPEKIKESDKAEKPATERMAEENANEKEKEIQDEETTDEAAALPKIHESYVIKPGDTIYQISMARYGNMDAMAEICRLNGLSMQEIIYPGQVIVLP